jgi:type VI secretion system protein ImpA
VLIEYINEYMCGVDSKSAGDDLEYSAEFIELERLVRGQDAVEYGEHVYAPDPVDWGQVEKLCRGLYENTLDLRVMVILARCLLERYGFSGFIAGLRLISLLLRERWECVHPQLVAEDQFDPLIRINTLAELAVPATIMVALKRQVLATTEDGQVLCLADLDIIYSAEGTAQSERRKLLSKLISPNCSVELVRSLGQINAIYRELNEITLCLEEKTGVHGISPLQTMTSSLRKWARVVEEHIRIVTPQLPVSAPQEWRVAAQPKPVTSEHLGNGCESREDVVRALDAICAYYQQQEPSSPVPFLLTRVRRLTSMSFINIIAELAPDALSDLRRLGESSID